MPPEVLRAAHQGVALLLLSHLLKPGLYLSLGRCSPSLRLSAEELPTYLGKSMSSQLALVKSKPLDQSALAKGGMPPGMIIRSLADAIQIGKILAASRYFKDATTEQQAIAKILRGWELGIPPVASLENINVIDGRTTLSAHLIAAKINDSGRFRLRIVDHTAQLCVIRFDEKIDGIWEELGVSEFTLEDARLANLLHKKNWQQYPKAMLYARAVAQGARWYCSTTFMGQIYVPEELSEAEVEDVNYAAPVILQSNSEQISDLLNDLGITDASERKAMATQYLGGRRAADLSAEELETVLTAIRQTYVQDDDDLETATETVEAFVVSVDESAEAAEAAPEPLVTPVDELPQDSRAAISAALDAAGIIDVERRQSIVRKQLMTVGRRKVETLTPEELQTVLEGIQTAG